MEGGGVVVFPTDTIYGLGANAELEVAVDRVFSLKGRDYSKPISVTLSDMPALERVARVDSRIREVLTRILPGAFTAILPSSGTLSHISRDGKIGVRIPDHALTRALSTDFPVTATSANPSGMPSPRRADEVSLEVDLVLDGGPTKMGIHSTVVDFTEPVPKILRTGSGDVELLNRSLDEMGLPALKT
ncbi:MAG: threonylcarbamoyl-AMP synthase [Theionarchaea archaeon]|nr:threonylcarbamoyl-AMP synthase [Theionarchaea archaeon]